MISKIDAITKLKKMGMEVTDDHSIVTILLPEDKTFEKGIKDIRLKLKEIGYESSFCIKQSKDVSMKKQENVLNMEDEILDEEVAENEDTLDRTVADSIIQEEISDEEAKSYMMQQEEEFSMEEDGQFTLGILGINV